MGFELNTSLKNKWTMKILEIKIYSSLVLMIFLLAMAFITQNGIYNQLFASLAIIIGAATWPQIVSYKKSDERKQIKTQTN
jgi:Zn-dependent protease with chaperone function